MQKYFLLRNNRESGPYSLPEMQALSLRKYDLVWIEDQSVIWKYPSEIGELMRLAPQAEPSLATLINNRKESQIRHYIRMNNKCTYKKLYIASINFPDAIAADITPGFEYLAETAGKSVAVGGY